MVEHSLGKGEVAGPIPAMGTTRYGGFAVLIVSFFSIEIKEMKNG